MDALDFLDRADSYLTRALIAYPDASNIVLPIQKHVKYALKFPKETDLDKYANECLGRMTARALEYADLGQIWGTFIDETNRSLKKT